MHEHNHTYAFSLSLWRTHSIIIHASLFPCDIFLVTSCFWSCLNIHVHMLLSIRRENVSMWCCWWLRFGAQRPFLWPSLRCFRSASSQHWEFFHPKKSALSTSSKPIFSSSAALWWHRPSRSGACIAESPWRCSLLSEWNPPGETTFLGLWRYLSHFQQMKWSITKCQLCSQNLIFPLCHRAPLLSKSY